ncbi:MAG: hypothetical protein AAF693_11650 [Bacteroidota bacterium]
MKNIVIGIFLSLTTSLSAQEWTLIYHNDEQGNVLSGDIGVLKSVVRNGGEIRIAWGFQHQNIPKVRVEHIADASFLTIQSDSIVHAQIRPITGQVPNFDRGTITLKENLEWLFIGGTNGKMDRMTRNVITGEIVNHVLAQNEFKWFTKK